jgi:hypothetical protein
MAAQAPAVLQPLRVFVASPGGIEDERQAASELVFYKTFDDLDEFEGLVRRRLLDETFDRSGLTRTDDGVPDRPAVKGIDALVGDEAVGVGQVGIADGRADRRRVTARGDEELAGRREIAEAVRFSSEALPQ